MAKIKARYSGDGHGPIGERATLAGMSEQAQDNSGDTSATSDDTTQPETPETKALRVDTEPILRLGETFRPGVTSYHDDQPAPSLSPWNVRVPMPLEGDIVMFVLDEGPNAGQKRPAVVVTCERTRNDGPCALGLRLFVSPEDAPHFASDFVSGTPWRAGVTYDGSREPAQGTWHRIARFPGTIG